MTTDFDDIDFLSDRSIVNDPNPYYDFLRPRPVRQVPPHGVIAVTGYDEAVEIWKDEDRFSSCNSFSGPFPPLGGGADEDDVSARIEAHRADFPLSEHLATFDPPQHTRHRALMMRLLTPRRFQENEEFLWRLADETIDRFAVDGHGDMVKSYANPFALLAIADLLGVPEEDHAGFSAIYVQQAGALGKDAQANPFGFLDDLFTGYVEERRRQPTDDVLTKLALASFPGGAIPDVIDVVRIAVFLFAAGQGTTAHLLGSLLRRLAEDPELQSQLRSDRALITPFIEETLRLESPVKTNFRMVRRTTEVGGVELRAGTTLMIMPGACNRDPRRFDEPARLDLLRANSREHIAFGRGAHACPGGSLARAETRISLERILDRLGDIALDPSHHGAPGERTFRYDPTFMLRGLRSLHVTFTPRR